MLHPEIEARVTQLAQELGAPLRWNVVLENDGLFDPLGKSDRYGEVCMVVRRAAGTLLTATKTFYPSGTYRLLTGGIHHGEDILDALVRETAEETGLETEVARFLAAVTYNPRGDASSAMFATFAFLLHEVGGTLQCMDPGERIDEFREIEVSDLPALADHLHSLGSEQSTEIGGRWRDWGRFRAVIHRAVFEALRGERIEEQAAD